MNQRGHGVSARQGQAGQLGSPRRPYYGVYRWAWKMAPASPSQARHQASRMARLEAVLFLAREPLSSRKLSQYANLADGTEARTLVARLNQRYDQCGRAFRVEQVAGGYQFVTRPKFADWLRRLTHIPAGTTLSAPAMETLAVIAYRQPATRAEVEAIRGVSCGEILGQLLQRDLVRIAGRSDQLGRPYLYQTTKRFMQLFGLQSLKELPPSRIWALPIAIPEGREADSSQASSASDVSTEVTDSSQGQEDSAVKMTISRQQTVPAAPSVQGRSQDDDLLRQHAKVQEDEYDEEDAEEDEELDDDDDDEEFEDDDEDFEDDDEEYEDEEDEEFDEEEDLDEGDEEDVDDEELDDEWEEVEDEEGEDLEEDEEWDDEDDDEEWEDEEEEEDEGDWE